MSWKALGFTSYQEFLASDIWKDKRDYILTLRPNCERCGVDKGLNVHHLNYERVGNETSKDIEILCWRCHKTEHGK